MGESQSSLFIVWKVECVVLQLSLEKIYENNTYKKLLVPDLALWLIIEKDISSAIWRRKMTNTHLDLISQPSHFHPRQYQFLA